MNRAAVETAVGIFVAIGLICVGYLTIKLGKMDLLGSDHYDLYAHFQSVSGLKEGAFVEMAGVRVGKVESISLEKETQTALVKMKLQKDVTLSDDVIASVTTAGLIGDKYIKISPGGSETMLKPGEMITETESSVNLEELISKYIFGSL